MLFGKAIAITGAYNSGKSLVTCMLAREYAKQGKKTLIIDFDIYNSSIHYLFNINKYKEAGAIFSVEDQIIKLEKNLYVFCSTDLLFSDKNTVDYVNLEDMIRHFKINYDMVLIDTTSYYKYKYLNRVLQAADGVVFLISPSILEVTKSKYLLDVFLQDFKLNKNKFQIVLNKATEHSIDKMVMSKMFGEIKHTACIMYDSALEKKILNKKPTELIQINEMLGE